MTNVRRQMKIPLSEMKISKLNMRHERKKPLIVDILPSVEKDGILQPLLVRREGDHWGVVAGRRRWWCLKTLAKKSGKPLYAPCLVLAPNDDAGAVEASLMENIGRLPPTEMQQYEAFGRLAAEGRSIGDIAHQFGITELSVRRVLALANLASEIRALYASDDITRETAQALTLASSDQQTEWLRLYADKSERAPEGRRCKAWIAGGEKISVEHALFDLAEYDGAVLDDLFGDDAIFADAPTFWKAQSAAIASRVEAYLADGWSEVQVMERGDYFSSYQYRSRTKKRGGKVYISVSYSGAASFHEGFITEQEASKLDKASASNDATATPIKPDMSGPMEQYVMRHRHAAAGAALLSDPAIGFRLAVTHMIAGSANWNVGVGRLPKTKEATTKSVDGSKAVMALSKEAAAVEKLLTNHGFIAATKPARGDDTHLCNAFSALLKMNDAEVMA